MTIRLNSIELYSAVDRFSILCKLEVGTYLYFGVLRSRTTNIILFFLTTIQFEEALIEGQQKITLDEPLNDEDRKFLRSIYCSVLPNQSIVDLTSFDTEKIQGYAIVLKQIDGKNMTSFCLNAL